MNSGGDRAREKEEPLLYTLWLATDTNSKQIKCNENNMKLNQHNRPLLVCALTSSLVEFNSSSSVEFFSRDIRNRSRTYFFSFGRKKKIYWLRNVWVNGKRDKKNENHASLGKTKQFFSTPLIAWKKHNKCFLLHLLIFVFLWHLSRCSTAWEVNMFSPIYW